MLHQTHSARVGSWQFAHFGWRARSGFYSLDHLTSTRMVEQLTQYMLYIDSPVHESHNGSKPTAFLRSRIQLNQESPRWIIPSDGKRLGFFSHEFSNRNSGTSSDRKLHATSFAFPVIRHSNHFGKLRPPITACMGGILGWPIRSTVANY